MDMTQQPVISLQSVHNLTYKKPVNHPNPKQFADLMDRHKKNKTMFHNKSQFKETLNSFLVPTKNNIHKEVN